MKKHESKAHQWIVDNDTGTSSKTIWAVMMGVITKPTHCGCTKYDVPHDADDFGRCHRLLVLIPEWRKRIAEVGTLLPAWLPIVREWDKLENMYREQLTSEPNKRSSKFLRYDSRTGRRGKVARRVETHGTRLVESWGANDGRIQKRRKHFQLLNNENTRLR